jgi:hypothetical protein
MSKTRHTEAQILAELKRVERAVKQGSRMCVMISETKLDGIWGQVNLSQVRLSGSLLLVESGVRSECL